MVASMAGIKRSIRDGLERWVVPGLAGSGLLRLGHRLLNRQALTVAMFHRVLPLASEDCLHAEREYVVGPEEFDRCLAFFRKHYSVVTLAAVEQAAAGNGSLPPHPLLITFDDGWRDNVEHAEPILRRHGLKATLFVNVEAVQQPGNRWWQDALVEAAQRPVDGQAPAFFPTMAAALQRPLDQRAAAVLPRPAWQPPARQMLTTEEIAHLDAEVWEVGSHGLSHAPMTLAPDPRAELSESARLLSGWRRSPVGPMSFPHGRYSADILALARSVYALVFTSEPVLTRARADRLAGPIGRIHVPSKACRDERSLACFFWPRSRA